MGLHCSKPDNACFACKHHRFNGETGRHECRQTEDVARKIITRARQTRECQNGHV